MTVAAASEAGGQRNDTSAVSKMSHAENASCKRRAN